MRLLNEIDLTILLQQLIYISIKSDVTVNFIWTWSIENLLSMNFLVQIMWRFGKCRDLLGLSYKVELIPEVLRWFLYKLDNSQRLHVLKSHFYQVRKTWCCRGEALHGNLAGLQEVKTQKLGPELFFMKLSMQLKIIEVIAIGKRR